MCIVPTHCPEAHLLRRPKGGLGLFVHFPYVRVLDGEDDEATGVFSEERLLVRLQAVFHNTRRRALRIQHSPG